MESCLSILIQNNKFFLGVSDYGALLLVSKTILEIVRIYLYPFNTNALDRDTFNAICEFRFDHVLARTTSPLVALRFMKLFGFVTCNNKIANNTLSQLRSNRFIETTDNTLSECNHINTAIDEAGNVILLNNVCSLDSRIRTDTTYITTNPIKNAIFALNAKVLNKMVKLSKCDLSLVNSETNCTAAIEIAILSGNTETLRSIMRMGITSDNMGYIITYRIMFGIDDLDNAYEMIHALLCKTTYADFTSFRFRDMEHIFNRILTVVHLIALLECGLDLNYLEDTKGMVTRYLANVLHTITTEDHSPLHLKNWLDITCIIAGSMHEEGRDELYSFVDSIKAHIEERLLEVAE